MFEIQIYGLVMKDEIQTKLSLSTLMCLRSKILVSVAT